MSELGLFDGSKMKPSQYQQMAPGWHKFKVVAARSAKTEPTWDKAWVVEVEVECTKSWVGTGEISKKSLITIWENSMFILGGIIAGCGIKLPEGQFKLKQENLTGKEFVALTTLQPGKGKNEGKEYTNFARFETVAFKPEAIAASAVAAAAKPAAADGIEEISADDL